MDATKEEQIPELQTFYDEFYSEMIFMVHMTAANKKLATRSCREGLIDGFLRKHPCGTLSPPSPEFANQEQILLDTLQLIFSHGAESMKYINMHSMILDILSTLDEQLRHNFMQSGELFQLLSMLAQNLDAVEYFYPPRSGTIEW